MGDLKSKKYDSHMKLLSQAYSMFAHTNPLHADRFPAVKVRRMLECVQCVRRHGLMSRLSSVVRR